MKFYTLEINGSERPAVSFDGGTSAYLLEALGFSYPDLNALITAGPEALAALKEKGNTEISAAPVIWNEVRILAPVVHPRQDMICLGINYNEHAVEAGRFSEEAFGGKRPYTIYFSKRVSTATGTGAVIPSYPGLVDSLDYEAELGVVLGKDVKGIPEENAEDAVFGYTVINDVSARNLQTRHKQWYLGKSLDGFSPMGPCIVTKDELGNAADLAISCTVNGELRQNSNTKYMIQTVKGAIAELSAGMTLQAGTIIAMGTPSGVGMGMTPPAFLKPGDRIVCRIEKIGTLENTVE